MTCMNNNPPIDWTKPLEVFQGGEWVKARLAEGEINPDRDGDYSLEKDEGSNLGWFIGDYTPDGRSWACRGDIIVRNRVEATSAPSFECTVIIEESEQPETPRIPKMPTNLIEEALEAYWGKRGATVPDMAWAQLDALKGNSQ